jgi:hypothetical protein
MHAVDEPGGAKPLGSKTEMSTNMTVFLAYAPVGRNTRAFQPKKNNNDKRKGKKGKDKPDNLEPSVYPTMVFSSDVEPEIIISRVSHEFGRAGGFYFRKNKSNARKRRPHSLSTFSTHSTTSQLSEANSPPFLRMHSRV